MEKYVSLNLFAIGTIGVWSPDESSSSRLKLAAFSRLVTLASTLFIFLPAALKVEGHVEESRDVSTGVEILALMISSFIVFGKTVNMALNRDRISTLLERMSGFWKRSTSREIRAMAGYAEFGRSVTRAYFVLGVSSIASFVGQPLVNAYIANVTESVRLPFDGWENVLGTESPVLFALVYVVHVFAGAAASLASIGHDCLFVVLILHVCANLKGVAVTLRHLRASQGRRVDQRIVECAKKFQSLTEYTESLEGLLSLFLLAQTLSSTFVICLTSFLLNREIKSNNELVKYVAYWSTSLFQLLVFCWAGNCLQTEAQEVGRSAYEAYGGLIGGHFLKESAKAPRHLQMIIIRAQNPAGITAGKFYLMSLENYKNILGSSYSYFTILRAFADKTI